MNAIAYLVPLLAGLIEVFRSRKADVAKDSGVSETVVGKVGDAVEAYLMKDEKAMQVLMGEIDKAREHDTAMNSVPMPPVVNLCRGMVRPVITFTAFLWYVYARVAGIDLGAEDYAIVAGILAFWFGFRPFEKGGRA
ncbi:MAG: hypothetical protein GC129_02490 [Proteobacteria bacterium]|nr:hypothetical protein [Pseudomonadota bacterium]